MSLGRTSLIHFGTQVVKSVAGFFTTLFIARLLGPSVLGTFAVATSLTVILTIPANTLSGAMSKRISERRDPSAYFTAGTALVLGATSVVSFALLVAAPVVEAYLDAPVVELLVLLVVATGVYNIYTSVLTGEKKVIASGGIGTLEQVLRLGFQTVLILGGYNLAGLFVGKILSLGAALVVGIVVSDLSVVRPALRHFRRLYEFARYSWMNQIKGRSFSWIDILLLGLFVDSTLIGIYEVSWTLSSTLILVSQSVQQTVFPEVSELSVTKDYDRVRHLIEETLVFVGIFGIPGFFGALIIGGELLTIYRPVFRQGYVVLLILICARLFDAYAAQLISVIGALDYPEINFRISGVFTGVNVGLNLLLIWQFGWIGAAVATMVAALVELILSYWYLSNIIGTVRVPYVEFGWEIAASVGMCAILYALTTIVPLNNYTVVGLVFVGAAVYVVLLIASSVRIRRKAWMLVPGLTPENVG
jgi:O-antigen/teichoic acid export membrane protein